MSEVIMPKMGDAMEEGLLLAWKKRDGETVAVGDKLLEIATDKTNVEIEAEDAGVLHIRTQPGETVPVGTVIAEIGDQSASANGSAAPARQSAGAEAPAKPAASTEAGTGRHAPPQTSAGNGLDRVSISPLARRVARERRVDLTRVKGSGPNGRIIEADIVAYLAKAEAPVAVKQPAPVESDTTPLDLSAMRKVIAKRMAESKSTIPHFYVSAEVDMAEAIALRAKLNAYDESLAKLSFNDMVVKAAARTLAKIPAANAVFRDNKIYPGSGVHVGVAVSLDDGLIVPVLRDADKTPLRQLSVAAKALVAKAREGKLLPNEYSGGTFTVSNMGSLGPDIENFIAIIDPAQGAILAVSSIIKKPVVLDDGETIAVRPMMGVTFSGDHRVMDGAVGARFLIELKRLLQNPLSLLE
jgi:pyruvate dehydrogenase E2 component (dihydrolipoamide acetyltransferase)